MKIGLKASMNKIALILTVLVSILYAINVRADDKSSASINEVSQCLKVATNKQPGNIESVDIKREKNRKICVVEIQTKNQEYKVKVDLGDYRILKVEEDD